jgi:hypothetical protein
MYGLRGQRILISMHRIVRRGRPIICLTTRSSFSLVLCCIIFRPTPRESPMATEVRQYSCDRCRLGFRHHAHLVKFALFRLFGWPRRSQCHAEMMSCARRSAKQTVNLVRAQPPPATGSDAAPLYALIILVAAGIAAARSDFS